MKRILMMFTILFQLLNYSSIYSQDLIDPYKDYSFMNILTDFKYPPAVYNAPNPNNFSYYPLYRSDQNCTQYTGEYMFFLDEHPWSKSVIFRQLAKTFTVEVVSFPFTTPCWDQLTSCGYPIYGTK